MSPNSGTVFRMYDQRTISQDESGLGELKRRLWLVGMITGNLEIVPESFSGIPDFLNPQSLLVWRVTHLVRTQLAPPQH